MIKRLLNDRYRVDKKKIGEHHRENSLRLMISFRFQDMEKPRI